MDAEKRALLAAACVAYAAAGGVAASSRADYKIMLAMQAAGVSMLAWMYLGAFHGDGNRVLLGVMGVLVGSLLARAVSLAVLGIADQTDTNRAAKLNRWDTLATTLAYVATIGFGFRAVVPKDVIPLGRGWLGTASVLVGAPTVAALGAVAFSGTEPDEFLLQKTASLCKRAYHEVTVADAGTDTQVLVIADADDAATVYVAFRGTQNGRDVVTDINVADTHPAWADAAHPKLRLHAGFSKAWSAVRDRVFERIAGASNVVMTGHSLGGALAAIASLDASLTLVPPRTIACYTYGAPQAGDMLFTDAFDRRVARSVRVYTPLDPIPKALSTQFVHVRGGYPVSPIFGAVDPHKLDVYIAAVRRPRALGLLGITLPLVYVTAALVAVYGARFLKRKISPGLKAAAGRLRGGVQT